MRKRKVFRIGFKGKKIIVKDYIECKSFFSKLRGLMFRSADFKIPLLFLFDESGRYAIHSFFCRKFLAVWMLKNKIIDAKIIEPWEIKIMPKSKFDVLLEIPIIPLKSS